jgi:hypothetical protein
VIQKHKDTAVDNFNNKCGNTIGCFTCSAFPAEYHIRNNRNKVTCSKSLPAGETFTAPFHNRRDMKTVYNNVDKTTNGCTEEKRKKIEHNQGNYC